MQNSGLKVDFYVSFPMMREKKFSGGKPEHALKTDILEILKDRTPHKIMNFLLNEKNSITLLTIGSFLTEENFSLSGLIAISAFIVLYLIVKRLYFARVGKRDR